MDGNNFMTISELSEYLKLPEETIYKFARGSRIPAFKVGRHWRFDQAEIDKWVASRSNYKPNALRILVVDDEPMVRELMVNWLVDLGENAVAAGSGSEALGLCEQESFDLVLLDLMMPHMNGVETLRNLKTANKNIKVVLLTAYFESRMMEAALELGPVTIVKKPVIKEVLKSLVASLSVHKAG
jgi:two-component system, response regulator, stage 0 sporulation protein F